MSSPRLDPKQRLIDVASRLFYADGIHAVGVDRVIAEAEVAKATLYAHFSGKADLVSAYLAGRSRQWMDAAAPRVASHRPGTPDAVLCLFDLLYQASRLPGYRGCPFINAAAEFPDPGPVATEIALHRQRVRAVFAHAGGVLTEDRRVLDAVVALYDGAMSAAHLDRDPEIVLHAAAAARHLLEPAAPHSPGG